MNLLNRIANYFANQYQGDDKTAPEFKVSVEDLREIANIHTDKCRAESELRKAGEIIRKLRKNMEQRWIPVSERLPEEHDSIFAKWKGTAKWNPAMFEKTSDEVLVTISDEGGKRTTRTAHTLDGKWSCDLLKANASYKVIAWRTLPEPYQVGAENAHTKKPQTNADRIRSMTVGDLAEFLCRVKADYQWVNQSYPSEEKFADWVEWLLTECEG